MRRIVDHEKRAAPAATVQTFAPEQRRHHHHVSGLAVRPRHANQAASAPRGDVALKLGQALIGGTVRRIGPAAAVEPEPIVPRRHAPRRLVGEQRATPFVEADHAGGNPVAGLIESRGPAIEREKRACSGSPCRAGAS